MMTDLAGERVAVNPDWLVGHRLGPRIRRPAGCRVHPCLAELLDNGDGRGLHHREIHLHQIFEVLHRQVVRCPPSATCAMNVAVSGGSSRMLDATFLMSFNRLGSSISWTSGGSPPLSGRKT